MINKMREVFQQAEDYFFSGIAQECLYLSQHAKAYITGVGLADLNNVYIHNVKDLNEILAKCNAAFAHAQLPFVIVIPEELIDLDAENILKQAGFAKTNATAAMALDLTNILEVYKEENGITIAEDTSLRDWMVPLTGGFGSHVEHIEVYAKSHELVKQRKYQFKRFCLYKDKRPVSALTLSYCRDSARIDDMCTLPEFQKKGYATILLKYAIAEAKKLKAKYCFLEASKSGLSLYQKCGFQTIFNYSVYNIVDQ
jgi:GNAT superfamily N-acetyltransferase